MKLEFKHVTKRYSEVAAVREVNCVMEQGIYGLLGVNGAGKTTLMRMLCTIIQPSEGEILWNGKEIWKLGSAYREVLGYADAVTTVSESYAQEIKTPFYGEHLDGLMRARSNCLTGIVNGIDYDEFNPETDKRIVANYNQKTFRKEKVKNKKALQQELGLEVNDKKFMIGIVSRLTDQKGFDLIAYMMDQICTEDVQLVVLGTGESQYENMFRHFAWKYPGRVSANIYYSEDMSHKIYASCDAFLMPSLFEPCGLSQLMSLRYGTVPIVRETGGLKDTVEPYNEYESTGTGFSFANYNAHEMMNTINYAKHVYYNNKREWTKHRCARDQPKAGQDSCRHQ